MGDSRQRAPFPHTSSSADLTSPELGSQTHLRPFPAAQQPVVGRQPWSSATPAVEDGPNGFAYFEHHSPPTSRHHQHGHHPLTSVANMWSSQPMSKRDSNELNHLNGNGVHDRIIGNPYLAPEDPRHVAPIYSLDTPSPYYRSLSPSPGRVPSPNVFALPSLSLPSLSTIRFISLCFLWYSSSALSSNTGKVILNNFRYPVTLTIVQFFFVAAYCYICSRPVLGWAGRLRSPSKAILRGTLPMAAFQVGGHIFSSLAISRVPVSTVHTIKALSPLFTVFAYALLFSVSYSPATYLSLLPLTLGVMLACSFDMSLSNVFGIICAFGSTLVFVSQNIFFKKIMPTNSESTTGSGIPSRLDKINLLYFSSGTAFLLMIPLWLYSDARRIVDGWLHPALSLSPGPSVPLYFFLNGTVHFAQNLLAFAILSSTSPVTYSIASLVKRIAVICMAIVWFKQTVHPIQALGIALTGVGLWMYNNAKRDVEKGEKKFRQAEAVRDGVLPLNKTDQRVLEGRSEVLFTKEVHSSPRPMYPPNFQHMSKSSAVRPTAFALPPPVIPVPSKQGVSDRSLHIIPQEPPYPSPPASTASSPPAPPIMESHTRQRNMSIDRQDSDFHLPSAVTRSENIEEETHSKSHILSPPIISAGA